MDLKQNVGIDLSMDKFEANLSVIDNTFDKKCLGTRKFANNVFLSLRTLTREREELLREKTVAQNQMHAAGKRYRALKPQLPDMKPDWI